MYNFKKYKIFEMESNQPQNFETKLRKERKAKLKVNHKPDINRQILELADCLAQASPLMVEFSKKLSEKSYPLKANPDALIYELW